MNLKESQESLEGEKGRRNDVIIISKMKEDKRNDEEEQSCAKTHGTKSRKKLGLGRRRGGARGGGRETG